MCVHVRNIQLIRITFWGMGGKFLPILIVTSVLFVPFKFAAMRTKTPNTHNRISYGTKTTQIKILTEQCDKLTHTHRYAR